MARTRLAMRRGEIIGRPSPRIGAAERATASCIVGGFSVYRQRRNDRSPPATVIPDRSPPGVDAWDQPSERGVAVYNSSRACAFEPGFKPSRLALEYRPLSHRVPNRLKVSIPQPLRDRLVDGRNWIDLGACDEFQQSVRIAVLRDRAVIQSEEGGPIQEPGL